MKPIATLVQQFADERESFAQSLLLARRIADFLAPERTAPLGPALRLQDASPVGPSLVEKLSFEADSWLTMVPELRRTLERIAEGLGFDPKAEVALPAETPGYWTNPLLPADTTAPGLAGEPMLRVGLRPHGGL